MKKNLLLFTCWLLLFSCNSTTPSPVAIATAFEVSSINTLVPDQSKMPFQGQLLKAVSWKDKLGNNTLILSEVPVKEDVEEKERQAFLLGIQYVQQGEQWQKLWEFRDGVDTCFCDCETIWKPETLTIEDIDQDGVAESSFLYLLNDRCDASPVDTRLMMHSGKEQLVVRGYSQLYLTSVGAMQEILGADFDPKVWDAQADSSFDMVDPKLKSTALQKWNTYIDAENKAHEVGQ